MSEGSKNSPTAIKPPLGLVPKAVVQLQRLEDIKKAIARYYNAELEIPLEWVEEYNELISNSKSITHD